MNLSTFPVGMFTPDFGPTQIWLSTDALGVDVQELYLYGYLPYLCIILIVDPPVYLTDDSGCILLTDEDGKPIIAQ